MNRPKMQPSLYETDFARWVEQQTQHLQQRNLNAIDWDNIREEIATLGRSDRRELENRLEVLLEHLLKRCYISSRYDNRGWELTIKEQRKQLRRLFRASPSLKTYGEKVLAEIWQDARSDVQDLYPQAAFPVVNPFAEDLDTLLAQMFWDE
ncbi:MAG: DUF29 domain-containing protein [Spirulinaceae cyanobacterium]